MSTTFDNVLNDYLIAVEEYFRLKGELEDTMKQGYLDISKARYIMGVTSVSQYQYSNDMTASATIHIDRSSTEDVAYAIDRHGAMSTATVAASPACEDLSAARNSEETSVRRRRRAEPAQADDAAAEDDVGEVAAETTTRASSDGHPDEQASRMASDPLRWFGVLVPPSLRSAQSGFVNALTQVAQLAALQCRCDRLRTEYLALKAGGGS